ncbi:unnamed protein product [Cuscuta campestris]|uniref:Uncharacterized protein n=1 Tax=Cuscuta campestris TaxID=132261 RepID=A0A484NCC3_9ASTE|nr:unnamed protein product [Cuscuta campestris]
MHSSIHKTASCSSIYFQGSGHVCRLFFGDVHTFKGKVPILYTAFSEFSDALGLHDLACFTMYDKTKLTSENQETSA